MEARRLQPGRPRRQLDPGAFQRLADDALLGRVVQADDGGARARRTEGHQEPVEVRDAPHRDDGHAARRQIDATAAGERLDRVPVALPLDEDDGAWHAPMGHPEPVGRQRVPIALPIAGRGAGAGLSSWTPPEARPRATPPAR